MISKSRRAEIQAAAAKNTEARIQAGRREIEARKAREAEEAKRGYLGDMEETGIQFDCTSCKQTATILLDVNEYAGCDCCGGGDADVNVTLVCSNCGETVLDWWSNSKVL